MKKVVGAVAVVLAMSGMVVFSKHQSGSSLTVDTHLVKKELIRDSILASGNLSFAKEIQVRSEVIGKVARVYVEEGDYVKKGQLLLSLKDKDFEADVKKAQISLAMQNTDIERLKAIASEKSAYLDKVTPLHQQKMLDEHRFLAAENALKIAQLEVQIAEQRLSQARESLLQKKERLEKTKFYAEIDGLITQVNVKAGETVAGSQSYISQSPLLVLADVNSYVAKIRVDEADLGSISAGQAVDVYAAATPQSSLEGKVKKISTSARRDQLGKGWYYAVEVGLSTAGRYFAGMSCRAELLLKQDDQHLSVPVEAVFDKDDKKFVWVVRDQKAFLQSVEVGLTSDTQQSIVDGLQIDDVVITGPSRSMDRLTEGTSVIL